MIRRPPRSTRTDTLFPTRRSSDLPVAFLEADAVQRVARELRELQAKEHAEAVRLDGGAPRPVVDLARRSEEHTSELQSLMRISYAVFCLKKKKQQNLYHERVHLRTIK